MISDGGLLLVRELDDCPGLTRLIENHLVDSHTWRNPLFPLADLFRQSAYSQSVGYEDLNEAPRLGREPAFPPKGSEKLWQRGAAAAGWAANQERERIGRSETSPWGEVPAARQMGGEEQTKQVSETVEPAAMQSEGDHVDLNLTREGGTDMVSAKA